MRTATTRVWVPVLIVLAGGTAAGLLFQQRWSSGSAAGGAFLAASRGQANADLFPEANQESTDADDDSFKEPLMDANDPHFAEGDGSHKPSSSAFT